MGASLLALAKSIYYGYSLLILPLRFGLRLRLGLQGMSIPLGEWGCPKTGDAHITVTPGSTGTFETRGTPGQWACFQNPSWRQQTRLSSFHTVHIFSAFCKPLSWIVGTAAWYFIVFLQNVKLSSVSVWCNVRVLQVNGSNRSVSLITSFSC